MYWTNMLFRRPVPGLVLFGSSRMICCTWSRRPERVTESLMIGCCVCFHVMITSGHHRACQQHETLSLHTSHWVLHGSCTGPSSCRSAHRNRWIDPRSSSSPSVRVFVLPVWCLSLWEIASSQTCPFRCVVLVQSDYPCFVLCSLQLCSFDTFLFDDVNCSGDRLLDAAASTMYAFEIFPAHTRRG